jgi:plastocyanin
MMRFARLIGVAAVGLAAACGGGYSTSSPYMGGSGGGTPPPSTVYLQGSAFNPATDTVASGTTLTWTNQDGFAHTVTYSSGPDSAFSGSLAAGASYQHTFTTPGTYQYYCTIHGTPTGGMRGTVVVR